MGNTKLKSPEYLSILDSTTDTGTFGWNGHYRPSWTGYSGYNGYFGRGFGYGYGNGMYGYGSRFAYGGYPYGNFGTTPRTVNVGGFSGFPGGYFGAGYPFVGRPGMLEGAKPSDD